MIVIFTVVCILLGISLLLTYGTVYGHFPCLLSTTGRRLYIHTSGDLEQEVSERAIQW
jgi:hypothetical protein